MNVSGDFYLPGFSMAVPRAFQKSITSGLFSQGDMFYDNKIAYEVPWGDALKEILFGLHVTSATRRSVTFEIWRPNVSHTKFQLSGIHTCAPADLLQILQEGSGSPVFPEL